MVIHTARQKITRIQRSRYLRLRPPGGSDWIRSRSSSFISGSAWCSMIIAGASLFYCRELRSVSGAQSSNCGALNSNNSDKPCLQARFHCTKTCPQWECYRFYLVQSWKPLRRSMLPFGGIPQLDDVKVEFHPFLLARVVR